MHTLRVERLSSITDTLATDLTRLLAELYPHAPTLSVEDFQRVFASDSVHVFVAWDDGVPAGMLTLVCATLLSGKKCMIEDVIVGSPFRRRGIATALLRSALSFACIYAARYIELTSRSEREEAHALYHKFGFFERQTHVYRLTLLNKPLIQ